jgi:N-acetylneuraminic acid mutarotase
MLLAPIPSGASWITTTSLPDGYSDHALVYWNGFLYQTGGSSATRGVTDGTNVFYSQLGGGGTTGLWKSTTSLPAAIRDHAGAAANGCVYVLGGEHYVSGTEVVSSTVYYAQTNANGSLGAWQTTTALPHALYLHSAAVWSNTIYIVGGTDNINFYSNVYSATIQTNGSLSAWNAVTSLPAAVVGQAEAVNGVLYVIGGSINQDSQVTAAVYYSKINGDGSLAGWSQTAPLPQALTGLGAIAAGGYVFFIGGWNSVPTNGFFAAIARGGGSLGPWTSGTPLPAALYNLGTAVTGSNIFVSGGLGNSGASSSVFSITLPPPVPVLTPLGFATNGNFQVGLTSATNTSFSLQASANLTNWTTIGNGVTDVTGSLTFQDTNATAFPQRFYRADWPLP